MKIAFWSPMHGTGATANLMALMLAIAEDSDRSVLLTQTHYCMNDLEGPLVSGLKGADREDYFTDMGIDAVIKYYKSGMLSKEILESCATEITDRISLLAGTRQCSRTAFENGMVSRIVERIFDASEEFYDWVVIDTNSGFSQTSTSILKDADIVVVTLRQNRALLDELFRNEEFLGIDNDRVFYIFGSYDPDSKYTLSNLKHIYRNISSANSAGLPHCTGYMDALCDRRAADYIRSGLNDPERSDREFFSALKEASKKLVSMTEKAAKAARTAKAGRSA